VQLPSVARPSGRHTRAKIWKLGKGVEDPRSLPISQADYIGQVGVDPGNNDGINLTDANVRELKMKAIAARNAEVRELAKEMPKFFNSVYATLSQESKQLVQAHDDYANAYAGEDANELLRIVRETHFTNVNGGGQAAQSVEDILNKQQEFAMLKQKNGESIAVFKKQFDDMVKTLISMGAPAMTEAQLGMSFLLKLDAGRHGNMLVELRNQAARGVGYPDTLKKAYDLASNWHTTVQEKTSGGDMHSVFVLSDNVRATTNTKSSPAAATGKEKTGGKGGGKSRFNNNQPPQPQRSQPSGGKKGSANDADASGTAATVTGDNNSGGERRICHLCKQPGHLLANCPSNPFAKGGSSTGTNLLAAVVGEEDDHDTDDANAEYVYREDNDEDQCDLMRNFVVVTPCCQQEHRPSACSTTTTHAFMFGAREVLFDCAAGRSVMKSRDLLHNIKQSSSITTIGGVNKDSEGITVSEDGEFEDLGRVGVSENSVANILSQAELLDKGFGVSYDTSSDQYCVKGTKKNWVFQRKRLPSGKRSPFYSCEVLVTTVEDNMRRYTAREVKQAKKALHHDDTDQSATNDTDDGHANIEPVPLPDMMPLPSAAAGVAVIPHTPTSLVSEAGVNASPAVVNADNNVSSAVVTDAADDDRGGAPDVVKQFTVRTSLRIANKKARAARFKI